MTCYDCLWDRHIYQSLRKSDVPRDQSIRESASCLILEPVQFSIRYAPVECESSVEPNVSGYATLAYLNSLLLYLKSGRRNAALLPENWQLPSKKNLKQWLLVEVLKNGKMTAIEAFAAAKAVSGLKGHVTVMLPSCICGRYETFGMKQNEKCITVTCDTCTRRIHRCCLMVITPGLTDNRFTNAFLMTNRKSRVRK